ncbi:MAG: phosphoribosylglycinamide formyltransferase [Clostridia bacterium]|nr:phosphoribosylglycinamide formyltransferase [Clostridia bacterium]
MTDGRVAVLVSGGGTNLQALIDAQKKGIIKSGRIVLVVSSNPEAYALTRAKNAGIPTFVAEKGSGFEKSIIAALDAAKVDFIVLAGFMKILSADFVRRYERRIINVHPSLIPSFCGEGFYGLRVHQAALDYGVKVTGATVHFVNEIPDGGEIIAQKAVAIRENDTAETLQKRVMRLAEHKILPLALEKVLSEARR